MSAEPDWFNVKASSSLPLSWQEVRDLPAGMVIIEGAHEAAGLPVMLLAGGEEGERRARVWQDGNRWSSAFSFLLQPEAVVRLPRLPRLSFALTTDAVRERQKTVTRRLSKPSWWKEGAWFLGVDKIRQAGAQGLCVSQCGPATFEDLALISQEEVDREGFPGTTPEGFCAMFRSKAPRSWDGWVWRLPFTYLEIPA